MRSPGEVRALAERLVALPSASPDPLRESACGRALAELLPRGIERGEWSTADGRPVVWALLPGRGPETVLLLGHYDTVGTAAYAALGDPAGERIALDCAALRERLLEHARRGAVPDRVRADLDEEAARPGTWLFGRGALDMKSGLAAAIAALESLAAVPGGPEVGALFVATPDEEHQSEGMKAAVTGVARLRDQRGLTLLGALNLDYCLEPAVFHGLMGKLQLGCYVLGHAAHVGDPARGRDALQLAAALISRVTSDATLIDEADGRRGVAPVALRLDDLRSAYSIEPVVETLVELNVLSLERPLDRTLAAFRTAITEALAPLARGATVLTWSELIERAGGPPSDDHAQGSDARAATLERLRSACRAARLEPPAVVLHLLPPFYPATAPGQGPLARAARRLAEREGLATLDGYPFISDASYVAWRGDPVDELAREFPSLGREYELPWREARSLDLDVVNLGPWGRDAHGLFERVRADYAFERLPRLIERLVREAASG